MKHDWEYKKLGEVGTFTRCNGILKSDFVEKGFPCIHYGQIHTKFGVATSQHLSEISEELFKKCKIANTGDIVLAITSEDVEGSCKCTAWMGNYDIAVGAHAAIFKHHENPKYLSYSFRSPNFGIQKARYARGFKVTEIKPSEVALIVIPVPPLPIQQQIVSELDNLSLIIEKKKQQLTELDSLAQAIFYDMFGDPVENEKGWEVKTFGEIGELQRGSGLSKKDLVDEGYPCILYGQIHTRFGAFTKKHIACIPDALVHTAKIAHPGDLIMAITSEDVEGSCKSTAWLGNCDIAIGSDAAIFRHNQDCIYVSFYTRTKAFFGEKAKYARGFKVTHISTKEIASIPIMLPPLHLQQSFATKIEAIEKQKELISKSIKEAQTLFDARMDYWFN